MARGIFSHGVTKASALRSSRQRIFMFARATSTTTTTTRLTIRVCVRRSLSLAWAYKRMCTQHPRACDIFHRKQDFYKYVQRGVFVHPLSLSLFLHPIKYVLHTRFAKAPYSPIRLIRVFNKSFNS